MKNKSFIKQVRSFTAFFDKNKNGVYTVTVPSLPGLVTEGNTIENARRMAEDAVQCYVEGLRKDSEDIPEETESAQVRITVTA